MFEGMPPYKEIIGVLFLAGVIAYAITGVIKDFIGKYLDRKGDVPDPWWWQGLFRLVPMVLGFFVGWPLLGLKWGGVTGVVGGVFSALLYKKVSAWLEGLKMPAGGSDAK